MTKQLLLGCAVAAFLLLVSVPVSAQPTPTEITVEAHDGGGAYWFQMAGNSARNPDLGLVPGESYRLTLENKGNAPHNFHIGEAIDAATPIIGPGETATLEFTVPSTGGVVSYWCDPHRSIGMEGEAVAAQDSKDTPGLGVLVVAGAVMGVASLVARRRR